MQAEAPRGNQHQQAIDHAGGGEYGRSYLDYVSEREHLAFGPV
jgi:hypothetical protein